jgi:hypothetical protein
MLVPVEPARIGDAAGLLFVRRQCGARIWLGVGADGLTRPVGPRQQMLARLFKDGYLDTASPHNRLAASGAVFRRASLGESSGISRGNCREAGPWALIQKRSIQKNW